MPHIAQSADALVIGAGPAGLAAAVQLTKVGFGVTILESADEVGSSWSHHYDRLHLHTARRLAKDARRRPGRSRGSLDHSRVF